MPSLPVLGTMVLLCALLLGKFQLESQVRRQRHKPVALPAQSAAAASVAFRNYHLGFSNFLGAILWIELLQKAADTRIAQDTVSWEYLQLHTITDLDPNFDRAYGFGAVYLSVLRQDRLGARRLLEKWVHRFPNSWRAHYLLGYHVHFEFGETELGGQHLVKASLLPGCPPWIASLGLRLLGHTGALAQAMRLSLELFTALPSPEARVRLRSRVRSLNFAIQKATLEIAAKRYREVKGKAPTTLSSLGPFLAEPARELAVAPPVDIDPELGPLLQEQFRFQLSSTGNIEPVKTEAELGLEKVGVYVPNH